MRFSLLGPTIFAVSLFLVGPTVVAADNCDPAYPYYGINCATNPIVGIDRWVGCVQLKVDIVGKSFLAHPCPNCAGASCMDCFHDGFTNAIDKWNHAYNAIFAWDKLVEVGGKPYDIKFHMYNDAKYLESAFLNNFDISNRSIAFPKITTVTGTCCDEFIDTRLRVVRIYIRAFDDTPSETWSDSVADECPETMSSPNHHSVKRFMAHEMGHGLGLGHITKGPVVDSIMHWDVCGDGPLSVDGEALACKYWPIYRCCFPN